VAHLKLNERFDLMLDDVVRVMNLLLSTQLPKRQPALPKEEKMRQKKIRRTIKTIVFRLNDNETPRPEETVELVRSLHVNQPDSAERYRHVAEFHR
jgi:hypothetical protein